MAQKTLAPATVDEYIAQQPPEARAMLEELRGIIRSAAPLATEGISYQMPVFRHLGTVAWIGGFKSHCSLFGIPAGIMDGHASELQGYRTAKGTIQFQLGAPIPEDLVRTLIAERVEANEAASSKKRKKNA